MRLSPQISDEIRPWLFAAPAALIFLVVLVYPMVYSIYLSLFQWNGISPTKVFVGFDNYIELFTDNRVFWIAFKNNVIWVLLSVTVPTGIGLALALVLNTGFAGTALFRSVFYFPAILSMSIVGLIWSWIYHPTLGLLNQTLHALGWTWLELHWLSNPKIALYSVFVSAAWHNAGLPMLLFLAGLQTIPKECIEAARIDGATRAQIMRFVTIPLLRETTLIVIAITAINSLKVYDIIYVMTYGGPANQTQVLGTWMYFLTYNQNEVGLGTAIAVILFVMTMIFAVPYARYMARDQ